MRIAIGSDHAGYRLKEHLIDTLQASGHDVTDLGTDSEEPVDYPPICAGVASPDMTRSNAATASCRVSDAPVATLPMSDFRSSMTRPQLPRTSLPPSLKGHRAFFGREENRRRPPNSDVREDQPERFGKRQF